MRRVGWDGRPINPRTWCGMYLCCREKNHVGSCEVDETLLTDEQVAAIEASRGGVMRHADWCCYMTGGAHGEESGDECCCGADH